LNDDVVQVLNDGEGHVLNQVLVVQLLNMVVVLQLLNDVVVVQILM
jgi:hypothetical protein